MMRQLPDELEVIPLHDHVKLAQEHLTGKDRNVYLAYVACEVSIARLGQKQGISPMAMSRRIRNVIRKLEVSINMQQAKEKAEKQLWHEINPLDLGLPAHAHNTLADRNINTLEQLRNMTTSQLARLPCMGWKAIHAIISLLNTLKAPHSLTPRQPCKYTISRKEDASTINKYKKEMLALLPSLTKQEQLIVVRRYGLDGNPPCGFKECGIGAGKSGENISHERARQLNNVFMLKLRKYIRENTNTFTNR